MFQYIWPLALVVLCNTFYQIAAKCTPSDLNPFASLVITYLVGALTALILYFVTSKQGNLLQEYQKLNWAPFVLGLVIVGLEAGYLYAYKAGWTVSTAQICQAAVLGIILIFVGKFLFKETITWNKIVGVLVCLVGLVLINLK